MKQWWKEHGLLLVNAALFVIFLIGMAVTGWQVSNEELLEHGAPAQGFAQFLASGDFVEAVFENWESEFLQMGSYVVLTVFLFQKGRRSRSRSDDGTAGRGSAQARRGSEGAVARSPRRLRARALRELDAHPVRLLFVASFVGHAISGAAAYSEEQLLHGEPAVTPLEYLGRSQFWFESFQNWQSGETVAAPHVETGT